MEKHKLLFFCSRFGGGGAEMHLLRVLVHADLSKYEIHLALTRDGGNYEPRLPKGIHVHYLTRGVGSSIKALVRSYKPLKKLIATLNPRVIISFMDPQNLMLSFIKKTGKNVPPIMICCQNAPVKNLSNEGVRGRLYLYLIPRWYQYATKVVAICEGVKAELQQTLRIKAPMTILFNAGYDDPGYEARKNEPLDPLLTRAPNQLVACGRLIRQKGFDVLMEALGSIKDETDFNIWILGEGEDRGKLTALRDAQGLKDRVHFLGFKPNPYQYFANADIFVLSSRWEGFGNVVTEAMICGCAVVSTNCDYGPNEIITNEKHGLICGVEDPISLAESIKRMIGDKALQQRIREEGKKRAADFSSVAISRQYFAEIEQLFVDNH